MGYDHIFRDIPGLRWQVPVRLGKRTVYLDVFDAATLRAAQENPEKYASLQVRVCGWNVFFNHLSRAEQDEFIRQAEHEEGIR